MNAKISRKASPPKITADTFVLDVYSDALELADEIGAKRNESAGIVLLWAVGYGIAGWTIQRGWTEPPLRCAALPGRVVELRGDKLTIELSAEAVAFAGKIGETIVDGLTAEYGADDAGGPISAGEMVASLMSDGLADLEREWLGSRFWNHERMAADLVSPLDVRSAPVTVILFPHSTDARSETESQPKGRR
jgi:hypothetical protein